MSFIFQNQLTLTPTYDQTAADGIMLETIQFYGYKNKPNSVIINGKKIDASSWTFDQDNKVLLIKTSLPLNQALTIRIKNFCF